MGHLRLQIGYKNYRNISEICDFGELHHTRLFSYTSWADGSRRATSEHCAKTEDYFLLEFEELIMVPELKNFLQSENRIKECQLVEAFICFLLQLLHPETDELDPAIKRKFKDLIGNLEKELRFLRTILGDSSLMLLLGDENQEFHKVWADFEAVANDVLSLFSTLLLALAVIDREFVAGIDKKFVVVVNRIDLLKTNVKKFLNLPSSVSKSACVTSVVDSLFIVDSLIYDLDDLINREDNPIADVKDQITTLHQGLTCLQSSIKDIRSPQPSEIEELKEPLRRIGDMAHQAEFLIISFMAGDAPLWYLINRLTDINGKIELIATELIRITKKYKSEALKVAQNFSAKLQLEANENTEVDDVTVGFEENAIHILDQLVGGAERLQIISIFGMPGLGKTTLAKKSYNHPSVSYRFHKLSWCIVSQTYVRQSILKNILICLASEFSKDIILKMDEESLAEHIYKTLKGRRYLVVMDDVWDSNVWDDLRLCFPDDGNGSRILFTTRNKDVAPPNSIIYALPSLSNDQCWELLEKKVFDDEPCPPELLEIGKKIAKNCGGLPLAVVVIAGVLSTMSRERSMWEKVQENLASYIFEDGGNSTVMQILELSYKHLPDHLKPCFLYLGAFEEDKEITTRKLMRLWIAEGFVHEEETKSSENVAEEYLMELIDKSLVMVSQRRSDGGVKACVLHDLLHDLCLKICEEEKFLKFEKSCYHSEYEAVPEAFSDSTSQSQYRFLRYMNSASMQRSRRLKHATGRKVSGVSTRWSHCRHIRSFHGSHRTQILYVGDMRLLRILDTDDCFKHLIGIEHLLNLRYLVIADDFLASINGRLVNLEYLFVQSVIYGRVVYLPPAIMEMRKLRYIHVLSATAKYHKDCNSSQRTNLEFLSGIVICNPKDEERLKRSPCLRKLKCKYQLSTDGLFDLSFLTELESLNIKFNKGFQKISFPSNIRKLTLSADWWLQWEKISIIGRLERLEVLKLTSICFEDEIWDTRDGEFQKLRFLKLNTRYLTQWNVASSQHFPKLQRLVLSDCENLEEIPSEIGEIATLEMIEVQGKCPESLVESAKRIQHEQLDMGNEELRVIINTTG